MEFKSINPYNGELIATHQAHTSDEINAMLEQSDNAFKSWRKVPIQERAKLMRKAAEVLREEVDTYAEMITKEMGKPISESRGEVKKCAWVCEYYAENTKDFLKDELIETDAAKSLVKHDPLGTIMAVMPWNFPFWQVFRFAAPTLMAGNTGVLKHASNVYGCAKLIEEVFIKAGFPTGVFQNLIFDHELTESIVSNKLIKAVSLTGSEKAGSTIAGFAGKYLKKSLMELGGNNAFIVWKDADIDAAVKLAISARMMNTGQSCIAAKRFILVDEIYEEFVSKFLEELKNLKTGDPMDESTTIGTLAREDLAEDLQSQMKKSIDAGAKLLAGGKQNGSFHEPTVLGNVKPGMPAFDEETFGPLAAMIRAKDMDEAFELSNQSKYGLGVTVCTKNVDLALEMSDRVEDGAYFINELVKSDPRLPFGGTKRSGYGRELAKDGMMEFINRKTIYVKS